MSEPEFGRVVNTGRDLAGHLMDMGQLTLAMQVLELQFGLEGPDDYPQD